MFVVPVHSIWKTPDWKLRGREACNCSRAQPKCSLFDVRWVDVRKMSLVWNKEYIVSTFCPNEMAPTMAPLFSDCDVLRG